MVDEAKCVGTAAFGEGEKPEGYVLLGFEEGAGFERVGWDEEAAVLEEPPWSGYFETQFDRPPLSFMESSKTRCSSSSSFRRISSSTSGGGGSFSGSNL